jgi:hypothetical protein
VKTTPVFAALLLVGCATAEIEEPIAALFPTDPGVLACEPASLSDGQTLTLRFGQGHGRELAIVREADETPYYLVVQAPPPGMRALMLRNLFAVATRVEMPASVTGYRWLGEGGNERIFTTPGEYVVVISDDLESGTPGHSCAIDYRG